MRKQKQIEMITALDPPVGKIIKRGKSWTYIDHEMILVSSDESHKEFMKRKISENV